MHEHLVSDLSALVPGATLDDPDLAARELALAAAAGLGTVVDPTVWGFGGPSPALPEIARAAGVHVIAGAGAYLGRTLPPWLQELSVDALTEHLVACLTAELPGCGFRAGVLGLIGTGHPVAPVEERVLRATAAAALRDRGVRPRAGRRPRRRRGAGAGPAARRGRPRRADRPLEHRRAARRPGTAARAARDRRVAEVVLRLRGAAARRPVVGDRRAAHRRGLRPGRRREPGPRLRDLDAGRAARARRLRLRPPDAHRRAPAARARRRRGGDAGRRAAAPARALTMDPISIGLSPCR